MSNIGEGGVKLAGENRPLGAPRGKRPRIRVSCVDQLGTCRCHHGHKLDIVASNRIVDVTEARFDAGIRYGGTVPGNEPGTAKFCCPEVDTLNVWLAEIVDE